MWIETTRLNLVPYRHDMVTAQHVSWLNDPEVVKFSEQRHVKHDCVKQRTYVHSFVGTANRIWLIRLNNEEADDIGTITAYRDWHNNVYNLGIMIGEKSRWGKGYGREAWSTVMDWCFNNHGRKVEAGVMSCNEAMTSICLHTGMHQEGVRLNHFWLDGKPEDLWLYGRLK